jgi:hypothetical protein
VPKILVNAVIAEVESSGKADRELVRFFGLIGSWSNIMDVIGARPLMTKPKRILYRGVPMIEGWPERIIAAQQVVSLRLEGRDVPRIRYGDEHTDLKAASVPCHDCSVLMGEFHVPGCDVEECPVCHDQLISCECPFDDRAEDA